MTIRTTIAITTAAALAATLLAGMAGGGVGQAADRNAVEVVVTPAQNLPSKGANVFYDDNTKLFVNASCKADIVGAGIAIRVGTPEEVQNRSYITRSERDTCAEAIADLQSSDSTTTTTAPTTTDVTTTTAPVTTDVTTTTAPTTTDATTTTAPSGDQASNVMLYVTSGTSSPTKGGYVVSNETTWTHIDKNCKADLLAAEIPTRDAVWRDVELFKRDQSITCEQIKAWITGATQPGWVAVGDEDAVYGDTRTPAKYFFFDPDNHTDPTWDRTRIGWLVECDSVKFEQVDPIVSPGTASHHLHEFFGNGNVQSDSTTQTIADTPQLDIRCTDVNDKSAYWSPAVYQDGELATAVRFKAYYKSTTPNTQPMPLGLRIVAGNMAATENQASLIGWYEEQRTDDLEEKESLKRTVGATEMITRTNVDSNIVLRVNFPNCWDGVHLDSADHQSHMAYFNEKTLTCPSTHPVKVPQLTTFTQYNVEGGPGFSLSSGEWYTYHQDFWNAWSPDQMAELNTVCLLAELNCRVRGSAALKSRGQYSGFVPAVSG